MNDLIEKTMNTTKLYDGRIINLRLDEVELPDGKHSKREIVEHAGGVGVIPYQQEKVILVKQFRKPIDQVLWEIPAGKLEPNEDILACGQRELEEETGYRAKELTKICNFYTSPGFTDELIHLYLATGLTKYEQNVDEGEFIEVRQFSISEIKKMIQNGVFNDSKTIIAIQYLLIYLQEN